MSGYCFTNTARENKTIRDNSIRSRYSVLLKEEEEKNPRRFKWLGPGYYYDVLGDEFFLTPQTVSKIVKRKLNDRTREQ